MTTLKVDKHMNIIDIDSKASVEHVVGRIVKHKHSYKFTPERLSMGLYSVPKRLTDEEQYQVTWIMDGLQDGGI
ncbi:conserved hypothetical protein [Vibrio phage 277E43-1]|nr:conserved hypothetical protein [Vibrio phage 277E43-1]